MLQDNNLYSLKIFNKIINRLHSSYQDIKVVTVHDSLIVQKKWKKIVQEIFDDEIYIVL